VRAGLGAEPEQLFDLRGALVAQLLAPVEIGAGGKKR
jgi:hypothetical protein